MKTSCSYYFESRPRPPGLLLALPRIHLLFFANMTAVMEEMSMEKEEESLGPFFLEHFDNSDYTMAVPGEGVRQPSCLCRITLSYSGGSPMDGRPDLLCQHLHHLPPHLQLPPGGQRQRNRTPQRSPSPPPIGGRQPAERKEIRCFGLRWNSPMNQRMDSSPF